MLTTQFIPAAGPPSRRLMIVLHGLGDSLEGWLWLPAALQLPWLNFLLVNAPDRYYGGWSWYDIETGDGIEASLVFVSCVRERVGAAVHVAANPGEADLNPLIGERRT